MRSMICLTALLALAACSKQAAAPPAADNGAADVTATAPAATPAAFDVKGTSWEYTDSKTKKPIQMSVDPDGNYISSSGTEHIDHGTAAMKDGKVCFTSAMTKDGEICWTDPKTDIGQSGETTNDKGEKLTVKRVAYVAKTM